MIEYGLYIVYLRTFFLEVRNLLIKININNTFEGNKQVIRYP